MADEHKAPEDAHLREVQSRIEQLEQEVQRLREIMRDLIKEGPTSPERK